MTAARDSQGGNIDDLKRTETKRRQVREERFLSQERRGEETSSRRSRPSDNHDRAVPQTDICPHRTTHLSKEESLLPQRRSSTGTLRAGVCPLARVLLAYRSSTSTRSSLQALIKIYVLERRFGCAQLHTSCTTARTSDDGRVSTLAASSLHLCS